MSYNTDRIYHNSINGSKQQVSRKRKKMKKVDFKKLARAILLLALTLGLTVAGVSKLIDKNIRDNKLNDANNYMRSKIITYLENSDLDYSVLEDKIIFEKDNEKIRNFVESLETDGFSRDEVIYMVSQICDKKDFDNVTQAYGYDNSQDFLDENYISGTLSNSGETYLQTWGDMKVFENNVELNYVESVDELKINEENKGLNR